MRSPPLGKLKQVDESKQTPSRFRRFQMAKTAAISKLWFPVSPAVGEIIINSLLALRSNLTSGFARQSW
jgi:hypothetical protein